MIYFLFIASFVSALLMYELFMNEKNKVYFIYLFYFFVILTAIAVGLRGNEDEYSKFYYSFGLSDLFHDRDIKKEFIFRLIVGFYRDYSIPPQFIYITFSSIAVIIYGVYYRKFTAFYYLAFLFYLSMQIFNREFSGLRLGFASMLVLPMIHYIHEKKFKKFTFIYLLSFLIQYVSVLSFLLLFLNKKFKATTLIFTIFIALLSYYSGAIEALITFIKELGYLPLIVERYISSKTYSYDIGLYNFKLIQQLLLFFCFIILSSKFDVNFGKGAQYQNLIVNTYFLSIILMIIFSSYAIFAFRFAAHFASVEAIFITYFVWFFRQKRFVVISMSFLLLVISYINYIVLERLTNYELFLHTSCDCLSSWCQRCVSN